jgi:hypothetical protein
VAAFWRVLGALAPREEELFCRFGFARRRLPAPPAPPPSFTILRMARDAPDASLPTGRTCFGHLELPAYSCDATLRRALLVAFELGVEYDLDGAQ